jgi:hypothetical protein
MVVRLSPAPHLRNWHGARCGLVLERIPDSDVVADQRRVLVVGAPRAISNNGPAMCTDPLHRRFVCDTVDPARMADAGKRQGPTNPSSVEPTRLCRYGAVRRRYDNEKGNLCHAYGSEHIAGNGRSRSHRERLHLPVHFESCRRRLILLRRGTVEFQEARLAVGGRAFGSIVVPCRVRYARAGAVSSVAAR